MLEAEVDQIVEECPTTNNCDFHSIISVDCDITYNNFFNNFMLKNLPCVVKNVAKPWRCSENWIKDNTINYDYLIKKYGDLEAPVADCNEINFNAQCKINMKVKEYVNYLKTNTKDKLLYLKDWHLKKLMPEENFYEVPLIFSSDWLNEFATDRNEDDFMFVYIGPECSWTPLHADVYNSYSWSVNVIGKKKWTFFPPGEEDKMKDSLGNLPLLFDSEKFDTVKYFEVIQEQGDAIFVPSGWHHQVVNLQHTISVNHNWVNACNLKIVWLALQNCLSSIEEEIQDLKESSDFVSQCQLILKSLFGMNFSDFVNFVMHIGQKRLKQLHGEVTQIYHGYILGETHIKFDLIILNKVMQLIHNHNLFSIGCLLPHIQNEFMSTKNMIYEQNKLFSL